MIKEFTISASKLGNNGRVPNLIWIGYQNYVVSKILGRYNDLSLDYKISCIVYWKVVIQLNQCHFPTVLLLDWCCWGISIFVWILHHGNATCLHLFCCAVTRSLEIWSWMPSFLSEARESSNTVLPNLVYKILETCWSENSELLSVSYLFSLTCE